MNQSRLARVLAGMEQMGLEQILVSAPESIYYLTGTWIQPGERMLALYLSKDGDAALYANRLFALNEQAGAPLVEFDDTDDSIALLAAALRPGKIGVDKFWPSQFTIRLMDARSDIRPVIGSQCVDNARMCKDAEELRLLRESSRKNDNATAAAIRALRAGMTEEEAAAAYLAAAKSEGASGPSFEPLVCFGAACAEPHHVTGGDNALKPGDSVILDVGLAWQSYASDMTRTVFFGEASDEQKRVYDLVCAANAAGHAAVRPGVPLREFDHAARRVIEDGGYGKYFIHRTGHGIGLQVHEPPDVSSVSETIAKPGMVFSIEPGVYLPGRFGVRVEDLVAVTEDGGETLNALARDFTVVKP